MGIRRTSHLTVRPDGTLQRVATPEPTAGQRDDSKELSDRFEELLHEGDQRDAAKARDAQTERTMTPQRFPWRDPSKAAGQAAADRGRDAARTKDSRKAEDAEQRHEDQSAEAGAQGASHAKQHKGGDQSGGQQQSGGGQQGDTSAALAAMQGEAARPQSEPSAPAATSAPEPSGSREISEVAAQVAARISTARSHGSTKVQIDLREDLLPKTSMTVEDQGNMIVVNVDAGSSEASEMVSGHAQELGQAISRRTGRSTRINLGEQSWTTEADQSAAGEARSTDDG